MKKYKIFLPLIISSLLASCAGSNPFGNDVMFFSSKSHLISNDFDGLGVEWGAYEDTNKLQPNAKERIYKYAERLDGMALVRCMISYDWICENFDDHGETDKTKHTWSYNFTNKWMKSCEEILSYCQTHGIDVAFGAWNVIGNFQNDVWGMMEEVTSDIRWAKITADVLDYLVHQKGFTCIKYFVNSNEPNYSGEKGSSKNYNNTFEVWKQGVLNVRKALDSNDLKSIKIVGGDATGESGIQEYLTKISKDAELKNAVGDYGFHMYSPSLYIYQGTLMDKYNEHFDEIQKYDSGIGKDRKIHIWECGLLDGKDSTYDCQKLITEFSYAQYMADFTIESLASGINGIAYWDFDDAMHFMYNADGTVTPKEWGMFSTLNSAASEMQSLRPWYHSSTLLINLFRKHNIIFDCGMNDTNKEKLFRSLATVSADNKNAGVIFCNEDTSEKSVKFVLDTEYSNNEKMFVYVFNSLYAKLGEDGFITPNYELEGSLNNVTEINVPSKSFVVISSQKL